MGEIVFQEIEVYIPDIVSAGNTVFFYTTGTEIANPFTIYSANRLIEEDYAVPLTPMSYQEYFEQPMKENLSTPTSYMYDRKLNDAKIYLWLAPDTADIIIPFTYMEKFESILAN